MGNGRKERGDGRQKVDIDSRSSIDFKNWRGSLYRWYILLILYYLIFLSNPANPANRSHFAGFAGSDLFLTIRRNGFL